MKQMGSILPTIFVLFFLHFGTEARATRELSKESNTECDEVYNLIKEAVDSKDRELVGRLQYYGKNYLGIDVSNSDELKTFVCNAIATKTLKGLYQLGSSQRLNSYERVLTLYKVLQEIIGDIGGYTNFQRYLNILNDSYAWAETLKSGSQNPKEATSSEKLTQFFQAMQVKFGSRWINPIIPYFNQDVVIWDPVETAKKLYEVTTVEEVMKIMSLDYNSATYIYAHILMNNTNVRRMNLNYLGVYAKAASKLGELGLYNLKY